MSRLCLARLLIAASLAFALGMPARAGLVDPTRPPERGGAPDDEPVGSAGAAVLQSVFIRGDRRVAVIDGKRLEIGDRVGAARLLAIDLSGVRLRDASGDWLLKLTGELLPLGLGNER